MRKDGTLSYLLTDHLGSNATVLNSIGTVVSNERYWPFGGTRSGLVGTDKQYTGQQREPGDNALDLYNYKARFYSTVLGRFLSVDPVVGRAGDPQSWNAYTYVRNNPLRLVDPSGMRDQATEDLAQEQYKQRRDLQTLAASGTDWASWSAWVAAGYAHDQEVAGNDWVNSHSIANERDAAEAADSAPASSGGGGGCGIFSAFCDAGAAVQNAASSAADFGAGAASAVGHAAVGATGWCASHDTCVRGVGGALVIGGAAACPFAAPVCVAAIVLGTGILETNDVTRCLDGSGGGCVQAFIDPVAGAAGVGAALEVTSIGSVTVGGAIRGNSAWRTAVRIYGAGAMVRVLPDLGYQILRNAAVSVAMYSWDLVNTGSGEFR